MVSNIMTANIHSNCNQHNRRPRKSANIYSILDKIYYVITGDNIFNILVSAWTYLSYVYSACNNVNLNIGAIQVLRNAMGVGVGVSALPEKSVTKV